ncbi:protein FAR1-RELATED SEQUENCE [Citrus sinensis]|uniref:Protein FAR1-RELATED SEQUENCE n=1 Tax=Citrus sinensis TaxID=2711 RepID=A0ACB8IJZ5_CITSI|nr:protein FAR1-RELATED SEQUENCE [Citrus sinensis]
MEKAIEDIEELEKIEEEDEPMIGISFNTDTEMFMYFKEYGKKKGFLVMRRSSRKDSDGILRNVSFACGRSGETRSKSTNILKPQPNIKTGCSARLGAGFGDDGKWTIRSLNLEHNHPLLTPTKSRLFRCNRSLSAHAKKKLDINDRARIKLSKNYQSLVIEAGGHENVTFIERDCRNHIQKERRLRLGDGDAAALQNYFMKVQAEDNRFFFTPIGIITDQDKAMKAAIENVFPNTRHRWCLWHILKKIPEKLGGYKEYRDISNVLHCAVYDSQSSAKFEETWHHMIVEFELGGNEWLRGLYNERYRWVPCYLKNSFWARMSTTQRSESMNAFFYGYVNSKTTLKQFVEQYSNALKNKAQKEVEEDTRCSSHQLPCVTSYAMEKQIRDVYTISKFQEFQQELVGKMYCEFVNSMGCEYIVREDVKVDTWKKRTFFEVNCDKENGEIHCSCSRFQFRGILCRHAITIMIRNDMEVLPEKFGLVDQW